MKGKMSGRPTNIVCWLQGGHYHDCVWGISYDQDNLLDEIEMIHYRNEQAEEKNVRVLGITEPQAGDTPITEQYELVYSQEQPPAFAVYTEVDSNEAEKFGDDPEKYIKTFKEHKGYDLPDDWLDPKNMPGQIRVINVEDK